MRRDNNDLTPKQAAVFKFIKERINAGMPPTMQEIADHFGFASGNASYDHVVKLIAKNMLVMRKGLARGLALPHRFDTFDDTALWRQFDQVVRMSA